MQLSAPLTPARISSYSARYLLMKKVLVNSDAAEDDALSVGNAAKETVDLDDGEATKDDDDEVLGDDDVTEDDGEDLGERDAAEYDALSDGGAAKEYNVLVNGEATESDEDLGDGEASEQKEEGDVAMKSP